MFDSRVCIRENLRLQKSPPSSSSSSISTLPRVTTKHAVLSSAITLGAYSGDKAWATGGAADVVEEHSGPGRALEVLAVDEEPSLLSSALTMSAS